jgi:hypothetical protein
LHKDEVGFERPIAFMTRGLIGAEIWNAKVIAYVPHPMVK